MEPFAGSLAVLLHRETPAPREVVCDTDGALCLHPDTSVLDGDLRYRRIGDFKVGDKVLGFDEFGTYPKGRNASLSDATGSKYRHWCRGTVTAVKRVRKQCFRLKMADGTTIIASHDHQWLAGSSRPGSRGWDWRITSHLAPRKGRGSRRVGVTTILKPCPSQSNQEPTYKQGWLGVFADGEGHLNAGPGLRLSLSQRPGIAQGILARFLRHEGYAFSETVRDRPDTPQRIGGEICATLLNGGGREVLRFLMETRPVRLIRKLHGRLP